MSRSTTNLRPAARGPQDRGERGVVLLDGAPLEYPIRRSRRRTVGLSIDPVAGLLVTAPYRVGRAEIESVVRDKLPWIARHLARLAAPTRIESAYAPGDRLLWRGIEHVLTFDGAPLEQIELGFGAMRPPIEAQEGVLIMRGFEAATPLLRRDALEAWAIAEAQRTLPERVRHYAARVGRPVRTIRITSPERQWGACSSTGRITLSWRLMLGKPEWAEYVAAHEACHLVHRHHQPSFWRLVGSVMPEYRQLRKELREASAQLVLPPAAGLS